MKAVLHLITIILILGWVFGFFLLHASGLIHILLVVAIIILLLQVIKRS
ncbi:MAG: lmo0937 family membrane protein [Ferruginibacter sp.]